MARSVAFKCTFNDGLRLDSPTSNFVGFRGTCSRDLIAHNINHHVWCGDAESSCKKFADKGMKGHVPAFPCLESRLFEDWKFSAGAWHNGPNKGKLIPIHDTAAGKIVILTTRRPDQEESERQIIGAYEIDRVDAKQHLVSTQTSKIRLTKQQSEMLLFWRYYSSANNQADWRTGLVRYVEDEQVHTIMSDISKVCGSSQEGIVARALLAKHFGTGEAPPPNGAVKGEDAGKRAALARKYPGGEGKDHKNLKLWVAKNPDSIGLPKTAKPFIEHRFESGDYVDIAFELPNKHWVAVEIETNIPYPGAHQAIKYRALLAAQRKLELNSDQVKATLVAWNFDDSTKKFCKYYDIKAYSCRTNKMGTLVC